MDIRIEFAECDDLQVFQADEGESGYEITSTNFEVYQVPDGRRSKVITIRITQAEEDEEGEADDIYDDSYELGYADGLRDGNHYSDTRLAKGTSGQDQQAYHFGRASYTSDGTGGATGGTCEPGPYGSLFNR